MLRAMAYCKRMWVGRLTAKGRLEQEGATYQGFGMLMAINCMSTRGDHKH